MQGADLLSRIVIVLSNHPMKKAHFQQDFNLTFNLALTSFVRAVFGILNSFHRIDSIWPVYEGNYNQKRTEKKHTYWNILYSFVYFLTEY